MEEHGADADRWAFGGASRPRSTRPFLIVAGALAIVWGFIWDDVAIGDLLSPSDNVAGQRLAFYLIILSITIGAALIAFGIFGTRRGKRYGVLPAVALTPCIAIPAAVANFMASFLRHFTW